MINSALWVFFNILEADRYRNEGTGCKLILNIFAQRLVNTLHRAVNREMGATIFSYWVNEPQRYGIVAFNNKGEVTSREMRRIFMLCQPDVVIHLAAETHVDRSIDDPENFIQSNIVGTYVMLDTSLDYWRNLSESKKTGFRFHHISTDEVFGSLGSEGLFTEETRYDTSSPNSASKDASDHLVRAWHRTYVLPVLITNCSNNYGPYQHPGKLIPLTILNALDSKPLPVYGRGENIRDWLYIDDHVRALWLV